MVDGSARAVLVRQMEKIQGVDRAKNPLCDLVLKSDPGKVCGERRTFQEAARFRSEMPVIQESEWDMRSAEGSKVCNDGAAIQPRF